MNPDATTASARARRAPIARAPRGRGRGAVAPDAPAADAAPPAVDPAAAYAPEEPVPMHADDAPHAEGDAQGAVADEVEDPPAEVDPRLDRYPGGPHDMSLLRDYHQHEIRYVWDGQV